VAFLLGGGAIPAAIGWLAEAGAFSLAIVGVGGVTLASVVLTHRLRLGE